MHKKLTVLEVVSSFVCIFLKNVYNKDGKRRRTPFLNRNLKTK